MLCFSHLKYLGVKRVRAGSLTRARQFHKSSLNESKKAVIFDMGGVLLPSPFGVANSKEVQ